MEGSLHPVSCDSFATWARNFGTVTQWEIFDQYMAEIEAAKEGTYGVECGVQREGSKKIHIQLVLMLFCFKLG